MPVDVCQGLSIFFLDDLSCRIFVTSIFCPLETKIFYLSTFCRYPTKESRYKKIGFLQLCS